MRSAPKTTTSKPNLKAADKSNTVGVKNNDANGVARTRPGFEAEFGADRIVDPGPGYRQRGCRDIGAGSGRALRLLATWRSRSSRICRRY